MTWIKSKSAHEQREILEAHVGHELAIIHEGAVEPGLLLRVVVAETPNGNVLEAFLDIGERFPVRVAGDFVVSCIRHFEKAE